LGREGRAALAVINYTQPTVINARSIEMDNHLQRVGFIGLLAASTIALAACGGATRTRTTMAVPATATGTSEVAREAGRGQRQ
jgi:hypothetical protein